MGAPIVIEPPGARAFAAAVSGLVVAAAATDVWSITGGNANVSRILRLRISAIATAAQQLVVLMVKRSTPNTGGTATVPGAVALDSVETATAKSAVAAYTANPAALGTATPPTGGVLAALNLQVGTAAAPGQELVVDYTSVDAFQPVLRSALESLAVNLNGVTAAGLVMNISATWCESP